ncbi:MAG TPA: hypothetical protein DIT01_11185 [Lentisphaeria bacterium]|nr:hypothetical protein [Lentisphaeria bacterium]|tara:strand:+ start:9571 stop:11802 length:2232 start_codon:yes stop_codon:yes gene_type:complete
MMLAALEFEGVQNGWLWLLAAIAAVGLTYGIYRGIFMRTGRRFTWALLALRCGGLLALALALAKPTWTRREDTVDPGRVAIIVDTSISMSLEGRYAKARKAVEQLQSKILSSASDVEMEVDVFDVEGNRLAEPLPTEPRTERTDLVRAVSSTAAQLRSKKLVALILISDGADNTGRQDVSRLADSQVPISCVGFRSDPEASRLDLEIKAVRALERVMVNNNTMITVTIGKSAGPAVTATVNIKRGSGQPVAEQTVELGAGRDEQQVRLTFAPEEAGSFVFTATVHTDAGERVLANNSRHFPLEVDGDAIAVLYLEGFMRFEYKFLRNRLEDDPDVHLVSEVRRANPQRSGAGAAKIALTPDLLKDFDLVILGDMESAYLAPAEYKALVNWVDKGAAGESKRANALLVLGGYQSFGADGFRNKPLADVLPVVFVDSGFAQTEEPFVLTLTESGKRHPIFQITGDRVADLTMWSAAPHLLGSNLIKRAKAAATVLAVNPNIIDDDGPAPLIVTGRYGSGQIMVIAADTTWRWTRLTRVTGSSDTLYARFWSQTVRWLTGREITEKQANLTVSTDKPDYDVGKKVAIRVVRRDVGDGDSVGQPVVEVLDETGKTTTVPVRAGSAEPDVFSGTYYPSTGGRYEVQASLVADGHAVANRMAEFLVHGSALELADTSTNQTLLQSIARKSGGVYVDIDDAEKLVDHIERKERRISKVHRTEYWNSPLLFLFFLTMITVEWVLRRRNHLV